MFSVLEIGDKGVSHTICSPLGDVLVELSSHGDRGLVAEVTSESCERKREQRETRTRRSRQEGLQAEQQQRGRHAGPAPRHDPVPHLRYNHNLSLVLISIY
jgi:hypothetical protein